MSSKIAFNFLPMLLLSKQQTRSHSKNNKFTQAKFLQIRADTQLLKAFCCFQYRSDYRPWPKVCATGLKGVVCDHWTIGHVLSNHWRPFSTPQPFFKTDYWELLVLSKGNKAGIESPSVLKYSKLSSIMQHFYIRSSNKIFEESALC